MAHPIRIHSPALCFVKQTLFFAKKNQEERIKSLTSKINTNQILQKNFNQELRIEVLNSLKTSLESSENSEELALALSHNNSLRQIKIFGDLEELKTAKEIYENQLREIRQLSNQEFAQKIYAPEKIIEDLSQENQASLQKWMDYFPHGFFHQPDLFIKMQSIAERQKNVQWITSLATFFVDHRHLFQGMYQAQTIFSQFLRMLSDASENREQLPIVTALLNATESPAFKFPNLTVILHFGLDTKNKHLVSTILKSKQALFLEDFTLQEMYPRLEGELKSTLENLWRKTHPDIGGLFLLNRLFAKVKNTWFAIWQSYI